MLPKVDRLMTEKNIQEMISRHGYECVHEAVNSVLGRAREGLARCGSEQEARACIAEIPEQIRRVLEEWERPGLKPVVNGTGIILHTGLGRAPLGESAPQAAMKITGGYSNLEYDLEKGQRGERCLNFEELVCRVTGAEAAMAVNNNAGAVLLALSAVAGGGEVVVSRGELVEIGGGFRIPEIMELGGARLREAGTTNRTRLTDYENAVSGETRAFLKVHTSNYRIVGFTCSVSLGELCKLGRARKIPVIQDLGSGVLVNLEKYGLEHEPTVQEAVAQGADVVCFSGDKLMGGPQAGIIAGRKEYIEKIRRHPLARALRIDKFTAAALEAVFREYLHPESEEVKIPVLHMLSETEDSLRRKAENMAASLRNAAGIHSADCSPGERERRAEQPGVLAEIAVEPCVSRTGGGSLPMQDIRSYAVTVAPREITAEELGRRLRGKEIPVIGRISGERFFMDVRTVEEKYGGYLSEIFRGGDILRKGGRP